MKWIPLNIYLSEGVPLDMEATSNSIISGSLISSVPLYLKHSYTYSFPITPHRLHLHISHTPPPSFRHIKIHHLQPMVIFTNHVPVSVVFANLLFSLDYIHQFTLPYQDPSIACQFLLHSLHPYIPAITSPLFQ